MITDVADVFPVCFFVVYKTRQGAIPSFICIS